jgi:amino acid adenylation domain-containing protein
LKNVEDIFPLSPLQQGILFHTLYDPKGGTYVEQFTFTLEGETDAAALRAAWEQASGRHPVLRTAFVWEGLDEPLQVVRQRCALPWEEHDWRGVESAEQRRRLATLLDADRARGFVLTKAPLLRLTLVRLADDRAMLVATFDHMLFDGWSLSLLTEEVFASYRARGSASFEQAPAPRPYRDYIAWLGQQDKDTARRFWRQALSGFTSPTQLPGSGTGAGTSGAYGRREARLGFEQTQALREMARRHRLTLNTLVQGAWALLLMRHAGVKDVAYGAVVSGRPTALEGVERMIGLFINTLPVRVRAEGDETAAAWLKRLQSEQAGAREYEHVGLAEVQGWSEVGRGTPLFESVMTVHNFHGDSQGSTDDGDAYQRDDASSVQELREAQKASYPLVIKFTPGIDLGLAVVYDRGRFADAAVELLVRQIQTVLAQFAAAPEQPLSEVSLSDESEARQLLGEWNDTARPDTQSGCFQQLFEAQVERDPWAVALVCGDERLTYRELNERANQLAHYLRGLGVGPEMLVGISMGRSAEMVVAVLGVFKAGGAYVPLDPAYPLERLSLMLEDSGVAVLLTQEAVVDVLPAHWVQVVCIDSEWDVISRESRAGIASGATLDSLAYVIYTSGSTGVPKGVMVTHRGIGNLIAAQRDSFRVGPGERVLQFASTSFDASVFELSMSLLSGATLYLNGGESLMVGPDLTQYLRAHEITNVTLPPSLLAMMAGDDLPRLQTVITAGEACSAEVVKRWAKGRRFFNAYGPTEATIWSTVAECVACDAKPTIGRPIRNTRAYVLDAALKPAPVGVPGELYVAAVGLARGYLGRPALTAERFIPDPFAVEPGARLYRTGDVARWLASGELEFVGRADNQVKVRGYRIELGEIESALLAHDSVRDCVVLAREDEPGDKRLVAYVVAQEGREASAAGLRAHLKESLPEYMVPSAFVTLDALPLSANGKVDRRVLPAPGTAQSAEDTYVAPRDAFERALCEVWAEVLRVVRVGVNDDFFALGGHSLLATQIVSRVKEATGVDLPLSALFERPNVAALAAGIDLTAGPSASGGVEAARRSLVGVQKRGDGAPLFWVHPAGGNVYCFRELAQALGEERPFYGLQSRGLNAGEAPQTSVEEMAAYYVAAVCDTQPEGPYFIGGWSMGGLVAYEMARQLTAAGHEVALVALLDTRAPSPEVKGVAPDEASLAQSFAQDLVLSSGGLEIEWERLASVEGQEERLDYVLGEARAALVLPPQVEREDVGRFYEVFKANVRAMHAYVPGPFDGRVTLFRAGDKYEPTPEDPTMGWGALAAGGVEVRTAPGTHYTMIREPLVRALAGSLLELIWENEGAGLLLAR